MTDIEHIGDGGDEAGEKLAITIRIDSRGRLYLGDITPGILEAALAVFPDDPALRARALCARAYEEESP